MKQNRQKNNMIKTAADALFDRGFMINLSAGVELFRLFLFTNIEICDKIIGRIIITVNL